MRNIETNNFEEMLIESAEKRDRMLLPERIELLKQSYSFFKNSGLSDEQIKSAMAITSHEMRLILHT